MNTDNWIKDWSHTDGSSCNAGHINNLAFPPEGDNWWCTEHQKKLVPSKIEDIPL